jgi:hypothetical protein
VFIEPKAAEVTMLPISNSAWAAITLYGRSNSTLLLVSSFFTRSGACALHMVTF